MKKSERHSRISPAEDSYSEPGNPMQSPAKAAPQVAQEDKIEVIFGDEKSMAPEQRTLSNNVRTTKYTLLTWAPLSLIMQFKRAANVYFLVITILTMMSFSPKRPASMIGTFSLVLIFTMLKEAYEDF